MFLLFSIAILSHFVYRILTLSFPLPSEQLDGLQSIFNAADGENWIYLYGNEWNFTSPEDPCVDAWQGVFCQCNTTESLCYVVGLELKEMNLYGTLSDQIAQLSTLSYLSIQSNEFLSGSLPTTFSELVLLENIEIHGNSMNGSVYEEISNLTSLVYLDLSFNYFSGNIESLFSKLLSLQVLRVQENLFSSKFPEIPSSLTYLSLSQNFFTGSISTSLFDSSVEIVNLQDNFFTGRIPDLFAGIPNLVLFYIQYNQFSGSIPSSLVSLANLEYFSVGDNLLIGSLVPSLQFSVYLIEIILENNRLSGSLPSSIGNCVQLEVILLAANFFTGNLKFLKSPKLVTVDVSSNGFGDHIPSSLFAAINLTTAALSNNCLMSSFPSSLCNATNLQVLHISGLHSSALCRLDFLYNSNIYLPASGFTSLPECIYDLPKLYAFYASGNNFIGKIPGFSNASHLVFLSLSHNRFSGSIPVVLEELSQLYYLDLSFNDISGTLEDFGNFAFNSSFSLSIENIGNFTIQKTFIVKRNRLSGVLPSHFASSRTKFDILEGNMFDCIDADDLPESDPYRTQYVCGSDELDAYLYVFVALLCVLVTVIAWSLYVIRKYSVDYSILTKFFQLSIQYTLWMTDNRDKDVLLNTIAFYFSRFRRFCFSILLYLLCICTPVYLIIKYANNETFRTHTFEYSWIPSLGFMQGKPAVIISSLLWLLFQCYVSYWAIIYFRESAVSDDQNRYYSSNFVVIEVQDRFDRVKLRQFLVLFANIVIVLFVNGLYVYLLLQEYSILRFITVLIVSLFRVLWNQLIIIVLGKLKSSSRLLLLVLLLNTILGPVLVTLFVDISCFRGLVVSPGHLSGTFVYSFSPTSNGILGFDTHEISTETVKFVPPFIYSGLCSNSILQDYIPAYVASSCMQAFVIPLIKIYIFWMFHGSDNQSHPKHELWLKMRAKMSYYSLISGFTIDEYTLPLNKQDFDDALSDSSIQTTHNVLIGDKGDRSSIEIVNTSTSPTVLRKLMKKVGYRTNSVVLNCVISAILLLSFGFMYPLLGVVLFFHILIETLLLQIFLHFHYLQIRDHCSKEILIMWTEFVSAELQDIHNMLFGYLLPVCYSSGLLIMLFVIDAGSIVGGIVLAALSVSALIILSVLSYKFKIFQKKLRAVSVQNHRKSVELQGFP